MGGLFSKYVAVVPSVFSARGDLYAYRLLVPRVQVLDRLKTTACLTLDSALQAIAGFRFGRATNDYGVFNFKSGETTQIRRSSKDLDIVCKDPKNADANARAISRANGAMWGNIILGGGIGAVIDHNKGTAYSYPVWMQLAFGKTLVFDRSTEKEGQPTLGVEPVATK